MNEERIKVSQEFLSDGFGLVAASGYINNEGGQAIADAANKLIDQGCKTLLIDLDGTRIINSIGVSILLEILEKLMDDKGQLAFCNLTPTISKTDRGRCLCLIYCAWRMSRSAVTPVPTFPRKSSGWWSRRPDREPGF